MAEAFLSLDARERADILRTVAARSGRAAIILEKDIWVCWVLQALFSMPDPHPMAFKGGTSLSKVYRIIDRFSEDVDVTLDYRAFNDGFDPFADGASRNQMRLFSERLKDRVANYIRDVVAPALGTAADRLAAEGQYDIRVGDDGETIRFAYPSAVLLPMAMGKRRRRGRQPSMWVASSDLPRSADHPFYERLNRVLDAAGFDAFVEEQCAKFYADGVGRPSLAPGRYFRMLLLGYFEGLDSERAIAWRAADSLSLRQFLDVSLDAAPPDHSTVSRTRRRIDVETHLAVFTWVLQRLAEAGLVRGKTGRHRRDDAGSQCGDSKHRTPGYGRGLRDVPGPTGGGLGHRNADARRTGPNGPQAPEEGVQ